MTLSTLDWTIVAAYFALSLVVGLLVSRQAGQDRKSFFLAGRNMPWWLLGVSMVATTFSTDTPNLVTDLVRQNGVSGNWVWWAFLLTGLLTVFVYAKLWRRSNVSTDMEFYELRYSGWGGKFLRGFRAIYLGVIFNVMAMSGVTLAAIKIGEIMLGISPIETILYAGTITVVFSTVGGFRGVIYTDFILFFVAIDTIGNIPFFLSLTEEAKVKRRNQIAIKSVIIAFFIMITFAYAGRYLLDAIECGISSYLLKPIHLLVLTTQIICSGQLF